MTVTNTVPPTISGTAQVGRTLTSSNGTWTFDLDHLEYAYQWLRCDAAGANCVDIVGATQGTYSPTSSDLGSTIRSEVTATEVGVPEPPPTGNDLPVAVSTLDSGEIAVWNTHDSSTSLIWGSGSRDKHRNVKWAAFSGDGGRPSFYSGRVMYAVMGFKLVTGFPNRTFNWHSVPQDLPDGWSAGGTACNAAQVSPLAFDITSGGCALKLKSQKPGCANPSNIGPAAESWNVLSGAEQLEATRNSWVWLWMECGWGNNYESPGGGYVKVYLATEDTPRVNISPVNTHWIREHVVSLWEGCYWSGGSSGTTVVHTAATRLGRTPQEAYEDVPVLFSRESAGNSNGSGGSAVAGTPVSSTLADIPAPLAW